MDWEEYKKLTEEEKPEVSGWGIRPKSFEERHRMLGGILKGIDIVEKPYYSLMNIGKDIVGGEKGFSPIKDIKRGFQGKERSSFTDILTEAGWQPETWAGKLLKGTVGFVGGVAFDPITWLGGAGKGIVLGGQVVTKSGEKLLWQNFRKLAKVKTLDEAYEKIGVAETNKLYQQAAKKTIEAAYQNPQKYFAQPSLRFGKWTIPGSTTFVPKVQKALNKALNPILKTRIGRETARESRFIGHTLGSLFDPGFDIKVSTHIPAEKKAELLSEIYNVHIARQGAQLKVLQEAQNLYRSLNKQQRQKVTFNIEKFLALSTLKRKIKGVEPEISKPISQIPKELEPLAVEARKYKSMEEFRKNMRRSVAWKNAERILKYEEATRDNLALRKFGDKYVVILKKEGYTLAPAASKKIANQAITGAITLKEAGFKSFTDFYKGIKEIKLKVPPSSIREEELKILNSITDPQVRKAVEQTKDSVEKIWQDEVRLKLRDPAKKIEEGYVKRIIAEGTKPVTPIGTSYLPRKGKVPTIEESIRLYKEGKLPYMFESDAGKLYLARASEKEYRIIKQNLFNYLKKEKFLAPVTRQAKEGWIELPQKFLGKRYQTLPEIAREISRVTPEMTPEGIKNFIHYYDEVLNFWKMSVTSLWLSFHTRNAMSNTWLAWLGGLRNPLMFKTATDVQLYGRALRKGKNLIDSIVKIGEKQFKLSELYQMSGETGILGSGWLGGDFIRKTNVGKQTVAQHLWDIPNEVRRVGTAVENNARVALFIDRLAKGSDVSEAAMWTKKFLFDYTHLTEFERNTMKRVVPFYTWLRKNIILQLEQIVKQPGQYTAMSHLREGIDSMSPETEEKFLPKWMREEEMFFKYPVKKPAFFNLDLPFQDLANIFSLRMWASATTPLVKGMFEVAANKDLWRGKPLADQNLPASKRLREALKQELLNNLRLKSVWQKATDAERTHFQKFLDLVFGIRVYPYDIALGRQFYKAEKQRERKAKIRLEREGGAFQKAFLKFMK